MSEVTDMKAYLVFCAKHSLDKDLDSSAEIFTEHFLGAYKSKKAWAKEYLKDVEGLTEDLYKYFNFDTYVSDCELNKTVEFIQIDNAKQHVYVFLPLDKE